MDQPTWMQDAVPPPPPAANRGAPTGPANDPGGTTGKAVRSIFHSVNLGLSVLMAYAAVLGVIQIAAAEIADFFLAAYLLAFAVLLASYEILRIVPKGRLQEIMRHNFGWFYGNRGRGLYLFFVGFLSIGLDGTVPLATGIVCFSWGALSIAIHILKPEWFEAEKGT